jgi:hypothetical protein
VDKWIAWGRTGRLPDELIAEDSTDMILSNGKEYQGWPAGPNFLHPEAVCTPQYYRRSAHPNTHRGDACATHALPLPQEMLSAGGLDAPDYLEILIKYHEAASD